ncbi:MAG: polysaccharide deacetylase family protein [Pseudomonadota bacterium]
MLLIEAGGSHRYARDYVAHVVFGEFLGLEFRIIQTNRPGWCIKCAGRRGELLLPDDFFSMPSRIWLGHESLPNPPLAQWSYCLDDGHSSFRGVLPVLFGQGESRLGRLTVAADSVRLDIDVLGTIFFMLSRYEEIILDQRDLHGRFPGGASLAARCGFLLRPVVDEYVEVLWRCMRLLWPDIVRKSSPGTVHVGCDVDVPYDCDARDGWRVLVSSVRDLIRRKHGGVIAKRVRNHLASRRGDYSLDPNHTFDWYMDACDKAGRRAAFNFIAGHSAGAVDGCYRIEEPRILSLMGHIHRRGHELGLHASYNSFRDGGVIRQELERLAATCHHNGIGADIIGNRQHFLRWDAAETADHLDEAGLEYDATGGYADLPGFRYGTGKSFSMWSWKRQAALKLRQRPLIMMECTIMSARYLGLGHGQEAADMMNKLKQSALEYGGDFGFLWHNSNLQHSVERELFLSLL